MESVEPCLPRWRDIAQRNIAGNAASQVRVALWVYALLVALVTWASWSIYNRSGNEMTRPLFEKSEHSTTLRTTSTRPRIYTMVPQPWVADFPCSTILLPVPSSLRCCSTRSGYPVLPILCFSRSAFWALPLRRGVPVAPAGRFGSLPPPQSSHRCIGLSDVVYRRPRQYRGSRMGLVSRRSLLFAASKVPHGGRADRAGGLNQAIFHPVSSAAAGPSQVQGSGAWRGDHGLVTLAALRPLAEPLEGVSGSEAWCRSLRCDLYSQPGASRGSAVPPFPARRDEVSRADRGDGRHSFGQGHRRGAKTDRR